MTAARPDPGPDGLIVDHELRIETRWLQAILVGDKRCEVRFNDRGYAVGDVLALSDGDASLLALVTHVLTHRDIAGLHDGWVVLSLKVLPESWRTVVTAARRRRRP